VRSHLGRVDVGQRGHGLAAASEASGFLRACTGGSATASSSVFHAPQLRAFAQPLGAGAAALGAAVNGFVFGHARTI
jgi:hypothetical protein